MRSLESSIKNAVSQINKVKENLEKVDGTRSYSMKEVFNDKFMSEHTKFSTISDFLDSSGLDFSSQEAFQNVDIEKLNKYVSENSDFSSWEEMKSVAGKLILQNQIF